MFCAGLDISTKFLDFVILNTEHPSECEHRRVELAREDGRWWGSVVGLDLGTILMWLWDNDVKLLGIERPYGPSRQAIASLHVVLGAVLAQQWPAWQVTVLEVRPAEMRKALGLKGNVSKETMHACIKAKRLAVAETTLDRIRAVGWPPDALDAWAVAWAAYRMCEKAAAGCRHDEHRKGGEPNQ